MQERIKFISLCKKAFVDDSGSPKTKKKWCKEHLNYSVEQWKMIIFSDESHFEIKKAKKQDLFVVKIRKNI